MRSMPNRAWTMRGVAALTAAALLATACGSTVPLEQQALLEGSAASDGAVAAGDGLGVDGTATTQGGDEPATGVAGGTGDTSGGSVSDPTLRGDAGGSGPGQQSTFG